jgi:hypothetical protein
VHFIILGQQRFALPVGETRIGGSGKGTLAFPELAAHAPMASILVESGGPARLWPFGKEARDIAVDGVPVGATPVVLRHGATIEAAGLRLVFAELRELRTATEVMSARSPRPSTLGGGTIGAAAGPRAQLVSAGTGVIAVIPTGTLVIGRAPDSDVVIPTRDVSRRHAVIRRGPEGYVIRDLSTNGTFVNGQRVNESLVLSMGDIISIGGEQLRFEVDAGLPLDAGSDASRGAQSAHSRMVEPPTRPRSAVFQ